MAECRGRLGCVGTGNTIEITRKQAARGTDDSCRSLVLIFVGVLLLSTWPAWSAPRDAAPVPTRDDAAHHNANRPGWQRIEGRWVRPAGTLRWGQLLRFDVKSGQLLVEVVPADAAADLLRNGRKVLVKIDGHDQLWNLSIPQSFWKKNRRGAMRVFQGRLLDRGGDGGGHDIGAFLPTSVNVRTNAFSLSGEGRVDGLAVHVHFEVLADGGRATLSGRIGQDEAAENFNLTSPSVVQLRMQHPEKVTKYLVPLLRELSGENPLRPRAGEVYRVFDHISADPQVTAKLLVILDDLGSPDPEDREGADAQLHALGPPGVLAALRLDRSALSPEQSIRLQNLIAEHSLGYELDRTAALRDVHFLQDAMDDPDPAVRAAARVALGQINASTP